MTAAAAKNGELRLFDAEEILLETSVGEEIYFEIPHNIKSSQRHEVVEQGLQACTVGKVLVQHNLRRQVRAIRSGSGRVPQVRWWRGGDGGVYVHGRHPCSRPSDDGEVRS